MRTWTVLINMTASGTVEASSYAAARKIARAAYGRRVDVIG